MPLRMLPRQEYSYSSLALQHDFHDVPSALGPTSAASPTDNTAEEWQARYERLCEAHKRLQRNNISLEEKLLVLNDKFQADKNILSRDLATQTQKVVESKLSLQHLNRENIQLKSDLKVALNLLQMRPSSFVAQKLSSLPEDLQARVKQYAAERQEEKRGQRITVSVPSSGLGGTEEAVSAAILAKILEERENERKSMKKFCIDIGTQTHGWSFPDFLHGTDGNKASSSEDHHQRHYHHHRTRPTGNAHVSNHTGGGDGSSVTATNTEDSPRLVGSEPDPPSSSSTATSTSTTTNTSRSCDDESDLDAEKLTEDPAEQRQSTSSQHVSSILLANQALLPRLNGGAVCPRLHKSLSLEPEPMPHRYFRPDFSVFSTLPPSGGGSDSLCRTPGTASGASSTSSLFGSLASAGGESLGMIRSLSSASYSALQTDL